MASSQIGTVDPSFNIVDNGYFGNLENADEAIYATAVQSNGKVLIAGDFLTYNGDSVFRIARLNTDGALDTTFNMGSGFDSYVTNITLLSNGQIIVVGSFTTYNGFSSPGVVRLNSDGSYDATFNVGTSATYITAAAEDGNGNLYVVGNFSSFNSVPINDIARLDVNGAVDPTFTPVDFDNTILDLYVQPSGMVIAVGKFTNYNGSGISCMARLFPDGTHDAAFDGQFLASDDLYTIEPITNGNFYAGGRFQNLGGTSVSSAARFDQNGVIDLSFNTSIPNPSTNWVYTISQTSNEVYMAGSNFFQIKTLTGAPVSVPSLDNPSVYDIVNNDTCVYLVGQSGQIDFNRIIKVDGTTIERIYSFGRGGGALRAVAKAIPLFDDKILIGSGALECYNGLQLPNSGIWRLHPNGEIDTSFNLVTDGLPSINDFIQLSDGSYLISGTGIVVGGTPMALIKVLTDGTVDMTFQYNGGPFSEPIGNFIEQPDGKVIYTRSEFGWPALLHTVERIMPNGLLDTSFNIQPMIEIGKLTGLALRSDGKIFMSGSGVLSSPYGGLVAYESDGTLDSTFNTYMADSKDIRGLKIDNNDNLLVAGNMVYVTSSNNQYIGIHRILPNDSFDPSFQYQQSFITGNFNVVMHVQSDDKILFHYVDVGTYCQAWLKRLFNDGSVDNTFSFGSNPVYMFATNMSHDFFLNSYNQIIIIGDFDHFEPNYMKNGIARILNDVIYDPCLFFSGGATSLTEPSCASSGSITLNGLNGQPPYTYNWNQSGNTAATEVIDTTGVYSCTITDANGCTDENFIYVTGPSIVDSADLQVNMVSTSLISGFNAYLWVDALNSGCTSTSGDIKVVLPSVLSVLSSTANQIIGDTLIWNYSNWSYDSTAIFEILVYVSPTAQIGDTVTLSAIITPFAGDIDTTNNIRNYLLPIVSSYDPNKKSVYPNGKCSPRYVSNNQRLTYTAQFQNTGTSDAINIEVIDTLSQWLDPLTFKVISSTHPVTTQMEPNNIVHFNFDNINLPDSASNELESHGHVIFEIYPKNLVIHNQEITNSVDIYFDFNAPITTNETFNTIFDEYTYGPLASFDCATISVLDIDPMSDLFVYPNPVRDVLFIQSNNEEIVNVELFNVSGHKLDYSLLSQVQLDVSTLQSGIYLLKVNTMNSSSLIRFVKE